MAIEYKPASDFPFWVVREDGAIYCACPTEAAAKRVIERMKFTPCPPEVGYV